MNFDQAQVLRPRHFAPHLQHALVLALSACGPPISYDTADAAPLTAVVPDTAEDLACPTQGRCPEWPCGSGEECFRVKACSEAICLPRESACALQCGSTERCSILESFPVSAVCIDPGAPVETCQELVGAISDQLARLQSCERDAACGQILPVPGCGCTRSLVASSDADPAHLETLLTRWENAACGPLGAGPCDCPPARGFACIEARCTWNYTQ